MATTDVINRLRQWREEGSTANRRLAAVILEDIEYASRASIAELSARARVSEPTVTRFCRALGCDGIKDLKHTLAQVMALGGPYLYPKPLVRDERDARIVATVADGAARVLSQMRDTVDMPTVGRVAEMLTEARQIVIFGSGGVSSMGAVEMHNRLFRLGLSAVPYTDGQMQRMAAAVCTRDSVVIAISLSGEVPSVVQALAVARQYGARAVAITEPASSLAREAEVLVPFAIPPDDQIYKPTSGRYGLLFVIDLIATATAEHIGPQVLEGLRRIRTALSGLNKSDPTRPIGD